MKTVRVLYAALSLILCVTFSNGAQTTSHFKLQPDELKPKRLINDLKSKQFPFLTVYNTQLTKETLNQLKTTIGRSSLNTIQNATTRK